MHTNNLLSFHCKLQQSSTSIFTSFTRLLLDNKSIIWHQILLYRVSVNLCVLRFSVFWKLVCAVCMCVHLCVCMSGCVLMCECINIRNIKGFMSWKLLKKKHQILHILPDKCLAIIFSLWQKAKLLHSILFESKNSKEKKFII